MGDIYRVLGQDDEARLAFQRALDISQNLAVAEPDRTDFQRDLSVSYNKMGDIYRVLGEDDQARLAYQRSLDIRERLAAAQPDGADAAWDLVVSLFKMAGVDKQHALDHLSRALAILRRLDAAGKLYPNQAAAMRQLEEMVGQTQEGNQ